MSETMLFKMKIKDDNFVLTADVCQLPCARQRIAELRSFCACFITVVWLCHEGK